MSQENLNSSYHESAEENEPGDSTLAEAVVQQRVDQLRDDFDVQYLEYEVTADNLVPEDIEARKGAATDGSE